MRTASVSKPAAQAAGFSVTDTIGVGTIGVPVGAWQAAGRIAARAAALDAAPAFPAEDVAELRDAGLIMGPVPVANGGRGLGTDPAAGIALLGVLRTIGAASLPLGRLYEAHVNAWALIAAYGTPAIIKAAALDAAAGHLFGLWVTDGAVPLRLSGDGLHGGKAVCSGAGHISRAVVTAGLADGEAQLALVEVPQDANVGAGKIGLTGMRAAVTGSVSLDGLAAAPFGRPGDYMREPLFSAGAWRTSAVTLGGLEALVRCVGDELVARRRADNPHQRARYARLLMLQETALLWMQRAAVVAEARTEPTGAVTGYVNLARLAVEAACLEALTLVQRSLGMNAFIQGRPVERIMRDLATYLRQPAADEALCEAAAWFLEHPLPV
jgi:alkylation response protein AidB-like acyl-CoA dehydrogenase